MIEAPTISHSTIGRIKTTGTKDGVLQCLGLQYATLADRFAPPVMKEYSPESVVDGTKLGPQVLSVALGPEAEFGLIQRSLDYDRNAFTQSDTEGLCLNITIPALSEGGIDSNARLPVFVFVHGGGFNVGSGMYPQYDMARFVRLSMEEKKPCIGVTLNYRLGAPGFLTSAAMQKKGYLPNNGLRDQRTALLWLRKHISGFGGDPEKITLAGESAGGISACYQLFSQHKLFSRLLSMSGTVLLAPPATSDAAEKNFQHAIKALELEEGSAIEELLKMDGNELAGKCMKGGVQAAPVIDGDLCPTELDFASIARGETKIPGRDWCEAAIIGDCQFDGNIQYLRLMHRKKGIAAAFCSSTTKSLESHPRLADRLLSAYKISPIMSDEDGLFRVLEVANDISFYVPTLAVGGDLARNMEVYRYRFNELNPWDGAWKGHATHILDIAFLLQNFNDFLDERQMSSAKGFAKKVISFVAGEAPWERGGRALVMGPRGKMKVVEDEPAAVGRRDIMLALANQVGFDVLNDAFGAFMKGPPPV